MIDRRHLVLSLSLTPGISGKGIARILVRNDLLGRKESDFLKLSAEVLREEYKLSRTAAERWSATARQQVDRAKQVMERLDKFGVGLLTVADASFPTRITDYDPDAPGLLFLYGNRKLLEAQTFCALSSRNTPPSYLERLERMAEEGVLASETLVSGHDTPEYQRTAIVPLRWGSPRVIVLDKGLFHALGENLTNEPFRAARLWRYQFDPMTDLAVSSLNPDSSGQPDANRRRDRLIGALSLRHDYILVNPGGMMERLAKMALAAQRPVRVCSISPGYLSLKAAGAEVFD